MTFFQILMLAASAFFAYKIYEHINTLKDTQEQSAQDENPSTSLLLETGDEEMQKGNLDKALAIYSEANIKEPNNDETLFKMGYTLAKQKRYEEALDSFKEALAIDDKNPFTHLEMANIYIIQEDFTSARIHLNNALSIDAEFTDAKEALVKLGAEV